jgi:hypothetical protein
MAEETGSRQRPARTDGKELRRVDVGFMCSLRCVRFLTKRGPRGKIRRHLPSILFRGGPLNPFHRTNRLAGDELRKCKYSDFRFSLLPPSPFAWKRLD